VGTDVASIADPVRHIKSEGGGIYCYTALKDGYDQISKAVTGTRHVILFADANDAEEYGDYKTLVPKMVADGITVSTIGMGSMSDKDADFLKDVAKLGNGRSFFANNPADLPDVFAQETVAVARSTFIKDPTGTKQTVEWHEIFNNISTDPDLSTVDGYNLSYLKPDATEGLITQDEYQAPLVAFWQRGLGHSMAISFPLSGDSSTKVRAWKSYGDFTRTVVRWLLGAETPPGVSLRTRLVGSDLELSLLYDDTWQKLISQHPPTAAVQIQDPSGAPVTQHPTWQKISPGRFTLHIELPPQRYITGAIQLGTDVMNFGPIVSGTNPEWTRDPARLNELKALSAATGGQARLNLEDIWSAPRASGTTSIRNDVIVVLLLVLLVEFLVTRVGLRWYWK
jgi:hypothetical protein